MENRKHQGANFHESNGEIPGLGIRLHNVSHRSFHFSVCLFILCDFLLQFITFAHCDVVSMKLEK